MPELAEVAYACSLWNRGLSRQIKAVHVSPTSRVFRDEDRKRFSAELAGKTLMKSETHGKQMLFTFSGDYWLGLHLGMTGSLHIKEKSHSPQKHDALLLFQAKQTLVFQDPRQFGRLRMHKGKHPPDWWTEQPVSMLSPKFTIEIVAHALNRHTKRPLKALLLDQRYFPGMGNWMADEVLWRANLHPNCRSAMIGPKEQKKLFSQILFVVHGAMKSVGTKGGDPPKKWLFHQRWKDGGTCPKSGVTLIREEIGGRTSCWSPDLQKLGE
ncbi:MAG: DNA-formamidopyrimidine glycosylase [Opitutae bacterium]|jgi:formamidopyrimidine-DNA glycosylase|nr:DNA-formamidopyrimidine glycosylase [Opitutae bacterium]|tara:strand:+ start:753 stop:1556 length:804 start_codon:yes stop_codon:yes gene_type:complete